MWPQHSRLLARQGSRRDANAGILLPLLLGCGATLRLSLGSRASGHIYVPRITHRKQEGAPLALEAERGVARRHYHRIPATVGESTSTLVPHQPCVVDV